MYNKIYERKEFMIFQVREGYIVYNAKKSFQIQLSEKRFPKVLMDTI